MALLTLSEYFSTHLWKSSVEAEQSQRWPAPYLRDVIWAQAWFWFKYFNKFFELFLHSFKYVESLLRSPQFLRCKLEYYWCKIPHTRQVKSSETSLSMKNRLDDAVFIENRPNYPNVETKLEWRQRIFYFHFLLLKIVALSNVWLVWHWTSACYTPISKAIITCVHSIWHLFFYGNLFYENFLLWAHCQE